MWEKCHLKRGLALIHHVAYMYVWVDTLFFKRLLFCEGVSFQSIH